MQDRVPPQNIEAEQSVLGAMLIEKEAIPKVMEILRDHGNGDPEARQQAGGCGRYRLCHFAG